MITRNYYHIYGIAETATGALDRLVDCVRLQNKQLKFVGAAQLVKISEMGWLAYQAVIEETKNDN